jgi:pimeloyl-ACP methyl ester carboxylesterase
VIAAAVGAALLLPAPSGGGGTGRAVVTKISTRVWTIHYRAHTGAKRRAYVVLPSWYGPKHHPSIPLVISPHGRGVGARANARLWGRLPAKGWFAVVSPDGAGRKLTRYSWGSPGQVEDLARMPTIVSRRLPWLRINQRRIYALGGSMGGQETLLLLARHPRLLAGVAAFDSVTDMARQYRSFLRLPCGKRCRVIWKGPIGRGLQSLARQEIGGIPSRRRTAYALRSPITYARAIARSCVPLQLWWSVSDRIVLNQRKQSGALYAKVVAFNRRAPVEAFVGHWRHSAEMTAAARLPAALAGFGLLPTPQARQVSGLRLYPPPPPSVSCGGRMPLPVVKQLTGRHLVG